MGRGGGKRLWERCSLLVLASSLLWDDQIRWEDRLAGRQADRRPWSLALAGRRLKQPLVKKGQGVQGGRGVAPINSH